MLYRVSSRLSMLSGLVTKTATSMEHLSSQHWIHNGALADYSGYGVCRLLSVALIAFITNNIDAFCFLLAHVNSGKVSLAQSSIIIASVQAIISLLNSFCFCFELRSGTTHQLSKLIR